MRPMPHTSTASHIAVWLAAGISAVAAVRFRQAGAAGVFIGALAATWGTQLGPRSSLAVTARRVDFDSPTQPYTENAIVATFGHRF